MTGGGPLAVGPVPVVAVVVEGAVAGRHGGGGDGGAAGSAALADAAHEHVAVVRGAPLQDGLLAGLGVALRVDVSEEEEK